MDAAIAGQRDAIARTRAPVEQLRRTTEALVRYFLDHRRESLVTIRDSAAADDADLPRILERRHPYRAGIEDIVERGLDMAVFAVDNSKRASLVIVEMCEAAVGRFYPDGEVFGDRVAFTYGEYAVRIAGVVPRRGRPDPRWPPEFRPLALGIVAAAVTSDSACMTVLIIGASVAGVSTAQALRKRGFQERITLLGEERHQPYDKPALSKDVLAENLPGNPPTLLTKQRADELDIDLMLGVRAEDLDLRRRRVQTDRGERLTFDRLVLATGVTPRTLPTSRELTGVYTLRTLDDALALRAEFDRGPRVVVIGAGFIGAEFASAARARGLDVSVVEAQRVPMAHLFGERVGRILAGLHPDNGVALETGVGFDRFADDGQGHVSGVVLADGRTLPADLVVVGIGARPATDWLESSGLELGDGVSCDAGLRAMGVGGSRVYAAGDIARRHHPLYGKPLRIEHWTNAGEHAEIVAADILGQQTPRAQVPYVWSDQYGRRIQIAGRPAEGRLSALRGGIANGTMTAVYADPAGTAVGALVVDDPRTFMSCRKAIASGADVGGLDLGPVAV
ncbi:FAD-dependent oxidoreductase [Streptomyces sp. NPDC101225]|uniref:FAD-dependent oxidoreductase n=1 Tax=Streptomyces sp. NPDC101225 TaxID=3366135 RepID=UPI0038048461